jgi:NAD(P)-dependent dehydrogenase (short-subunit alcohol dehydrogenase family)
MRVQLKDKVILVTGSTTGIGEAIARRAVAEGAYIVVHGRDRERGRALAAEWPGQAALAIDDLADADAAPRIVQAAIDSFGRLDAIVNNAAQVTRSDLASTDAAFFDNMMAVNVRAPLLLIRAAISHLKQARGCILNIGSINAYTGEANLLGYSISKGALMTLSRNLADALCYDGVRVNHFNVGWVLTPNEYKTKIGDGLPRDWPQQLEPQFAPSGRILEPAEIAAAAVYWLSDESRPISGSVVELEQYPIIGRNPTKRGD